MQFKVTWNILMVVKWIFMLVNTIWAQGCRSISATNCQDIEGRPRNYDEKAYPCFADGLETPFCRCRYANENQNDKEAINTRMMCAKEKRFVGEEWHDKDTCQVKTCTVDEQVEILRGGCEKKTEDTLPEKKCVQIGAPAFPCVYEGKFYENCLCEKYDDKNAIAKPVMCGSHDVGSTYISNCNEVTCNASGEEVIIKRMCQKADGSCVDSSVKHFPCFVHGLYRGVCKCNEGCVEPDEQKHAYRSIITFRWGLLPGKVFISLAGTVNETPLQELFPNHDRTKFEASFKTQYVGIPRKIVFQVLGPETNGGTDFKEIIVHDVDNYNKRYTYNKTGQTGFHNGQWEKGPNGEVTNYNEHWVKPSVRQIYEGVCKEKECDGTDAFMPREEYLLKFFCPFLKNPDSNMDLDGIKLGLVGEHLSTGLVDLENEHLLETRSSDQPYPVFTGKYVLPYCGKVTHFVLLFTKGGEWTSTCTIRVKVKRRSQEFEFRYNPSNGRSSLVFLDCMKSPHCGKSDWDLVCENDKLAEWCKNDFCCNKKQVPCGRYCYQAGKPYEGRWSKSRSGKQCKDPCSNAYNWWSVPKCLLPNGDSEECDIPECRFQRCDRGHCYMLFEKSEQWSASKDFCFNEFGGRLAMVPEDNPYFVANILRDLQEEAQTVYNPKTIWFGGLRIHRSPTRWFHNRDMLEPFIKDIFITFESGELALCIFHWNSRVYCGQCTRPGRPLCEVLKN